MGSSSCNLNKQGGKRASILLKGAAQGGLRKATEHEPPGSSDKNGGHDSARMDLPQHSIGNIACYGKPFLPWHVDVLLRKAVAETFG